MNRSLVCLLLALTAIQGTRSQQAAVPSLLLVVPEQDTTFTSTAVYRLSASATPGCQVTLNGVKQNVYASGAFAGLLRLSVGENRFVLEAIDGAGRTGRKEFLVFRTAPVQATPRDTLRIEPVMMQPWNDLWLDAGDLLEVQCKGTPGCRATFLDSLPMRELAPAEAGGLRGIYRGTYRVRRDDRLENMPVMFRLQDSAGNIFVRESRGKICMRGGVFPMVGVTKGLRPSLGYGTGEDRLGGAVMQRLVPGVRLCITGKLGDMYRVQLAEGHEAWIDAGAVDLQPPGTARPHALTGNWSVYGDDRFDYVSVSLADRLPYVSSQDLGTNRIIVDVFGAVSNSNWITQQLTTKEITNVTYRQVGKEVFRILIDLKHHQPWGYTIGYEGGLLTIRVKRQPEKLKLKALTFVVDAGHGGDNNGALGSTGYREKDVNLATALHLKRLLENEGAAVVLTRGADSAVSMQGRLATALSANADILISIHSNSIGLTSNPEDTRGVSTYYKHIGYRPLSQCILKRVIDAGVPNYGNVGSFNFLLVSPTEMPNVLVELAYMSNPLDEMKLLDDGFRKDLARAIVEGVEDFLGLCDE